MIYLIGIANGLIGYTQTFFPQYASMERRAPKNCINRLDFRVI
jgi:hypothetical protein